MISHAGGEIVVRGTPFIAPMTDGFTHRENAGAPGIRAVKFETRIVRALRLIQCSKKINEALACR